MKRAAGFVLAAGLFERHTRGNDVHDVRSRNEFVEKRVWNTAGHGPPLGHPPSLALIFAPTEAISARPWALVLMRPMTLPMSLMLEAPVAATASLIRASISAPLSCEGM